MVAQVCNLRSSRIDGQSHQSGDSSRQGCCTTSHVSRFQRVPVSYIHASMNAHGICPTP